MKHLTDLSSNLAKTSTVTNNTAFLFPYNIEEDALGIVVGFRVLGLDYLCPVSAIFYKTKENSDK